MRLQRLLIIGAMAAAIGLAGCNGGSTSAPSPSANTFAAVGPNDPVPTPVGNNCANPSPPSVVNSSITDSIPSDLDPTSHPTPTTTIYFTVFLPKRCPGDTFPLVLQSAGFGGKRLTTLAANNSLHPSDPHFASIDELAEALPYYGYVVISFDERGLGESVPQNGGGYARIIDPNAETQDARAILDWAYNNAATYNIETLPHSGIPNDLMVGTLGYSYGGGFQMPLALLDPRIKTIVPNGTWNDLLYSLIPGNGVKLSFDGLLCLLGTTGDVSNTPLVANLCNSVGIGDPLAQSLRTREELVASISAPTGQPRPIQPSEVTPFFFGHSTAAFQQAGPARALPALFLQGNRDVLFNLTEAYWNYSYFAASGADVRVMSTEGGHMNPLANQAEGTANCGSVIGVSSVLTWFNHYLRGAPASTLSSIPKVCISIAATQGEPNVNPVGVSLPVFPVGSQSGTGAIPAVASTLVGSVNILSINPSFVPVLTVTQSGAALAGVPRIKQLVVTPGLGALSTVVAYVGVGILRGGSLITVNDQVTPFEQGTHTNNIGTNDSAVLLPAVGEQLQPYDQVGLVFYTQNVQYSAIVSASALPNLTNVVNEVLSTNVPPIASSLQPLTQLLQPANPYTVVATDVELPIIVPGSFPGSALLQ